MGDFFGSLYCTPFEDFFGMDLAEYLWGYSSPEQTSNMFISIGLWMFGISAVIATLYYYVFQNPRISRWWGWMTFMGANAIINLFLGWQLVLKDMYSGLMLDGNGMDLPISEDNILCFGVSNMLISILVFFIISLIIKWWSRDCSRTPF